MKKQVLFGLWAGLFIVCAGLGFIPEPEGGVRTALTLSAIFAFVPPAALIWQACKSGDNNTLSLIRSLSAASLGLTSFLLILNSAPMHLVRNSCADSISGKRLSRVAFTSVFSGVPSGWKIASTL